MADTRSPRFLPLVGTLVLLALGLISCATASTSADGATPTTSVTESPVATPSTTPTPEATATPEPEPEPEPVTFTYECHVIQADGTAVPVQFATLEEIWADPAAMGCAPIRHGDTVTEQQRRAVDLALAAYSGERESALEGLHVQCAKTDNGYLAFDRLSWYQDDEVRGMLELCPNHPGADKLRSALPEG